MKCRHCGKTGSKGMFWHIYANGIEGECYSCKYDRERRRRYSLQPHRYIDDNKWDMNMRAFTEYNNRGRRSQTGYS